MILKMNAALVGAPAGGKDGGSKLVFVRAIVMPPLSVFLTKYFVN